MLLWYKMLADLKDAGITYIDKLNLALIMAVNFS